MSTQNSPCGAEKTGGRWEPGVGLTRQARLSGIVVKVTLDPGTLWAEQELFEDVHPSAGR